MAKDKQSADFSLQRSLLWKVTKDDRTHYVLGTEHSYKKDAKGEMIPDDEQYLKSIIQNLEEYGVWNQGKLFLSELGCRLTKDGQVIEKTFDDKLTKHAVSKKSKKTLNLDTQEAAYKIFSIKKWDRLSESLLPILLIGGVFAATISLYFAPIVSIIISLSVLSCSIYKISSLDNRDIDVVISKDSRTESMFLAEERNQSLLNNYNPVLSRNTRYRLETRNKNWLKRLKEYKFNPEDIAEKECNLLEIVNLIFAVGLNHLPGEFGLLQMLKKEGYEVEPCLDWNLMQEPMPIKEQNKTITATLSSWFKDFKEVVYRLTNAKKELLNLCDIYSDKLENIPAETQITDEQKDALRKMEQNMYKINKHLKACGFNKEESSRAVIKENMHKVRNLIGDGKKSQAKVKDFGLCG